MIPTKGCVKNYHWGQKGEDSYIARFQAVAPRSPSPALNGSPIKADDKTPLAELWFGSHPSGPATLAIGDHMIKLNEFIAKEPEMVGVIEHYIRYNKQLPFLLKVLSVAQPLSLQAHPDQKLAQILHKQDPKNYPDDNHKPELAIALSDFHILCDFRPHKEIVNFIRQHDALKNIVGKENYDNYCKLVQRHRTVSTSSEESASASSLNSHDTNNDQLGVCLRSALANCFKNLMTCPKDIIISETKSLIDNAQGKMDKDLLSLIIELEHIYPGDPGLFAPFFLNYFKLSPGQGIFLKPNKLHAYLKGECIECMACSDNVVRAGLTTKYRDVQTLISMLDYEPVKSVKDLLLAPQETTTPSASKLSFLAPAEEFKVEKITVTPRKDYTLESKRSGSFVIVLNGKALTTDFFDLRQEHKLRFGFVGFIPPLIQPKISNIQGTLVMYRAFC